MAKNSKTSKTKKNTTKSNGLVTSNNNNSKKKMYPEISMVCDFFCRYLINSNIFTLEQILNFKTNLRTILLKKYKQYTWDKKQPLKGNACRSILVLKSTLDPILVVAGYKAGFLKMDENDLNLKSEHNQEIISNLNISINNFSNVITITPPPDLNEDFTDDSSKRLNLLENNLSQMTINTNASDKKGKTPISYETFKNIFLTKGEFVLWCDPGSVSYSLDDGQIVTLYDKEKEKLEQQQHKKANKNHKSVSPNIKNSGNRSPSLLLSPSVAHSETSPNINKKSPLILPASAVSKKDKKKNKKKERKDDNNSNNDGKSKTSPNSRKYSKSNHANVSDIQKNTILENSPIMLPPSLLPISEESSSNKTKHISISSIPSLYSNNSTFLSPNISSPQYKIFNSLGRPSKVNNTMIYSPELSGNSLNSKNDSFLFAIPNNDKLISSQNFTLPKDSSSKRNLSNNNYKNKISGNLTEKAHPFIGILSRSAVMV